MEEIRIGQQRKTSSKYFLGICSVQEEYMNKMRSFDDHSSLNEQLQTSNLQKTL